MDAVEQRQIRGEFMPLSILRAVWKRKLLILSTWLVISIIGAIVVYRLPAVYQARSVILIEQQRIPERYVAPTVNEDLSNRLNRISQQILAYEPLLRLIEEFNLYESERTRMVEEEIVQMLRDKISVSLVQGWAQRNAPAFQIVFEGDDPSVVAQVTNRLSTLFIDENLRTRSNQALGTAEFLTNQLEDFRQEVERQEELLREYRTRNMGELPQQERVLLSEVQRLQGEIVRCDTDVERARQSKILYENSLTSAQNSLDMLRQMAKEQARAAASGQPVTTSSGAIRLTPEQTELNRALEQLAALEARYSDSHPDVIRGRSQVEVLRQRVEAAAKAAAEEPQEAEATIPSAATGGADSEKIPISSDMAQSMARELDRINQLQVQISLLDDDIKAAQTRRQELVGRLGAEQGRLGRIPMHEQELSKVVRDYDISVRNYQALLDKRIEADLASELETRQKAEKFTVLEPARLPEKPIRPDRELLMLVTCGAGLVVGCLLGFGTELRSNVLLGEWELPPNVAVLGQVPMIQLEPDSAAAEPTGARSGRSTSRLPKRALIASSVILSVAALAVATSFYLGWISF
ncbi:MAG: hypothetical protein GC160_05700 [Acidobacteria bacterium]|nr:hypothetical protein [Acidobacteriota bacterium]